MYLDIHSYGVLSLDQAFVIANTRKYQLKQRRPEMPKNEDSCST